MCMWRRGTPLPSRSQQGSCCRSSTPSKPNPKPCHNPDPDRRELLQILDAIFYTSGMSERAQIPKSCLSNFLQAVGARYQPNAYHNLHHATQVTHSTYLLRRGGIGTSGEMLRCRKSCVHASVRVRVRPGCTCMPARMPTAPRLPDWPPRDPPPSRPPPSCALRSLLSCTLRSHFSG